MSYNGTLIRHCGWLTCMEITIFIAEVNQCFQSSAFLRKSAIFVLPGNFCTWFSNFRQKNPQKKFFFVKNFFSVKKKKKLFRVTIFRKQNGGWTHLRKKNKIFFRRKWRPSSSAQGEQEKWHSNLSCARRIRKAETSLKSPSSIFLPIRSVCIGIIGSLIVIVRVRQISNSD